MIYRLECRAELWFITYFFSWFTDWSAALSYDLLLTSSHDLQIGVPRWVMIYHSLLLMIYFSHRLECRAELWFITHFSSWFISVTDWSAALSYITDGETEEHLEMLDGGVIKQLLDEKWKTYAQVMFRVNTFRKKNPYALISYPIEIFTYLKLCLATAIHNLKWVKITYRYICSIGNQTFANLISLKTHFIINNCHLNW